MRTALLAAVSHDLRSPLAAAKAAASCLRSHHVELTAEDHDELLAAADESLDRITHITAGRWRKQQPHCATGSVGRTISRLTILPVGPFGSTSTIHTWRGYLYAATRLLT